MPTRSASLSLVPNREMATFFSQPGVSSMNRSPMSMIGERIDRLAAATRVAAAMAPRGRRRLRMLRRAIVPVGCVWVRLPYTPHSQQKAARIGVELELGCEEWLGSGGVDARGRLDRHGEGETRFGRLDEDISLT